MKYFLLIIFFITSSLAALAQAPNISYSTPQFYQLNATIAPLIPANTGGTIPVANGYGRVVSIAGNPTVAGSADGTGSAASFTYITSAVVDAAGNIFVVDNSASLIRKITPANVVSTFAGGARGYADGTGIAASFNQPRGLAIDASDNIYVADYNNNVIRKITPAGVVTTIAGTPGLAGNADGARLVATFTTPQALVLDVAGNIYVTSATNTIRKITPIGDVSTFAGQSTAGSANGIGIAASFSSPKGLTIDATGNIYVGDVGNGLIRKITPAGVVTTVAGSGGKGYVDGASSVAQLGAPSSLAIDRTGNIYFNDEGNARVRMVSFNGVVNTVAGNNARGYVDDIGALASFGKNLGMTADGRGYLYVTDEYVVRKVTILGYTIDKPLPAGLTFDSVTGIISGTPTTISATTNYTITGYNAFGSNSTIVNLGVGGLAPNISYQTPQNYPVNQTISPLIPANAGGVVPPTIYGQVSTFAGSGATGSTNGVGAAASFRAPYNATIDAAGNIYVADCSNHMIRKITTPGAVVTTLAGNGSPGYFNGTGTGASFNNPGGVTVDQLGNVYVGDQTNNVIRKITPLGVVTTFAGSGVTGFTNGTTAGASFSSPAGLVFDSNNNLYVADRNNNAIRKITPAGVVSTFAGNGSTGASNGTGTAASFKDPTGLAVDAADNIYVSDQDNNLIRKITPSGVVTTFAGSGAQGNLNGPAATASFNNMFSLSVAPSGNLYVSDEFNQMIREISPAGVVRTLIGNGTASSIDGIGAAATLNYPIGVIPDGLGNLYVTETVGQKIRKIVITGYVIDKALPAGLTFDQTTGIISGKPTAISAATTYTITAYNLFGSNSATVVIAIINNQAPNISYQTPQNYFINKPITPLLPTNTGGAVPGIAAYGQVSTFAGTGIAGSNNGTATTATFNAPTRTSFDVAGNAYVTDRDNNLVRKITTAGVVSTYATGFNQPNGPAVDLLGNVYVADAASNSIKKILPGGIVTTLAGSSLGYHDGLGTLANFYYPYGVALDAAGNIYVADSQNHAVRKITALGLVSTLAGNGSPGFVNAAGLSARFTFPSSVILDDAGNVYVCDSGNQVIRKITPAGVVSTLAGTGATGAANGSSTAASFNTPSGIALDPLLNFYVADQGNNQIRKIDANGNVTTLAGNAAAGNVNGIGSAALFNRPNDVAYSPDGFVLVTDYGNNMLKSLSITGYSIDKTLPAGLTFDGTTGQITGTPTVLSPLTVYTITAYNLYGSSTTTLTLQVTNLPDLQITANNQTRIYGIANPPLTVTYTGFNPGDDASKLTTQPIVTTTATLLSPVGTYPITVSGAGSPTYNFTYVAGTLTITVAPRVLLFNPIANKVTTDADFDPGATLNTSDPIIYTSSDPTIAQIINGKVHILKAGSVIITASVASKANYADVTSQSQALVITAITATLQITANNQTRVYGATNPPLTLSYVGFTAGDDASKLTTQATVSTTATVTSPVGSYPIAVSGASSSNYIITYVQGLLTVTVAPRALTFNAIADKVITDADFDPGAVLSTNDPIVYTSSDPTIAQIINGKIHILRTGKVIITATVASKLNYADVAPQSQPLLILDDYVRIPPVVTPNGDNINDVLKIDGIANYPDNRFTLVNINGVKIYEIDGYDNVKNVFDGHSNITTQFQPRGTYFYSLQFNVHGQKQRRVGYVVLKY